MPLAIGAPPSIEASISIRQAATNNCYGYGMNKPSSFDATNMLGGSQERSEQAVQQPSDVAICLADSRTLTVSPCLAPRI